MNNSNIEEVLAAWKPYIETIIDWEELVDGIEPKPTGCGPVYEVPNPIDRPGESFAIADMRNLKFAEPHCHRNGETEIYFVITGLGKVVVGGTVSEVKPGDVSVTPPDTAHFTIPTENLVLAVVNTPPFNPDNVENLTESNPSVGYDAEQLATFRQQAP